MKPSIILMLFAILLVACTPPTPPPPTMDVSATQAAMVATIMAQHTQTEAARPTQTPTVTSTATSTETPGVTSTPSATDTSEPTPTLGAVSTTEPTATPTADHPAGATALCVDGTYSYAASHRGACSRHGGVAKWYK